MAAVATPVYVLPAIDWTSGAAARLLASVSQICNLGIRHARRHASKAAFRGAAGATHDSPAVFCIVRLLQSQPGSV